MILNIFDKTYLEVCRVFDADLCSVPPVALVTGHIPSVDFRAIFETNVEAQYAHIPPIHVVMERETHPWHLHHPADESRHVALAFTDLKGAGSFHINVFSCEKKYMKL